MHAFGIMIAMAFMATACSNFNLSRPKNECSLKNGARANELCGKPNYSLNVISQPLTMFKAISNDTAFQIEVKDSNPKRFAAGSTQDRVIQMLAYSENNELIGTFTASTEKASIASFSDIKLSVLGKINFKFSLEDVSEIVAESSSVSVKEKPEIRLSLATTTSSIFCPRTKINVSNVPDDAAEYCLNVDNPDTGACTWNALPIPSGVRAPKANSSFKVYLWIKDNAGKVFSATSAIESNSVSLGTSVLPTDKSSWSANIANPTVSGAELDELICRTDELTQAQGLALASLRISNIDASRHLSFSKNLNAIGNLQVGYTTEITSVSVHKILWRLMMTNAARSQPFSNLDLSAVNLSGRNISGMDFSNTNITSMQFNGIDPNSNTFSMAGLDLAQWAPSGVSGKVQNFTGVDLTGAKNINWSSLDGVSTSYSGAKLANLDLSSWKPGSSSVLRLAQFSNSKNLPWPHINANTHSLNVSFCSFEGVDMAGFNPVPSARLLGINLSNAKNVNFTGINANTAGMNGIRAINFSGVDMTGWNPPTTQRIAQNTFIGATNIPWAALNANTNASGLSSSNFSGLDLGSWNPPSTQNIAGIVYTGATNIPWSTLNATTHTSGISTSDFSNMDLSAWNPPTTQNISGINFQGATNIPWAALNANTHASYMQYTKFIGQNLASWTPGSKSITGIELTGATNIPWAAINAGGSHLTGAVFKGLNLSSWNPSTTVQLQLINLSNATNVPWTAINASTASGGIGNANFSNVNLSGWNPSTTTNIDFINFTGAVNFPWAAIIANSAGSGTALLFENTNMISGGFNLSKTFYAGNSFKNATNIPWTGINAISVVVSNADFTGVNLTGFNPPMASNLAVNMTDASNIPWNVLNNYTGVLNGSNLTNQPLENFRPSNAGPTNKLQNMTMPIGARNPNDFAEAAGYTPPSGYLWTDGTVGW